MSYLSGWPVIPHILVRRERWPGGDGSTVSPLAQPGQYVQPDQPVMRVAQVRVPHEMSPRPQGQQAGVSAASRAGYDLGKSAVSNAAQSATETIPAGLRGKVVEVTRRGGVVIECQAALIRGVAGVGNQVAGVLTMWPEADTVHAQPGIPPGALLVIPGPLNFALLRQAVISGVAGVIGSSISTRDLEGFLHTDLLQLMDSVDVERAQLYLPPLTLLLTEGFGTFAMPRQTLNMLSRYQGSIALLSGATSIRRRIFPELLIALPEHEGQPGQQPARMDTPLAIGAQVRICSGEYEGACGEVDFLFAHEQMFASGVRAPAAQVRLEEGIVVVSPLVLLERIG